MTDTMAFNARAEVAFGKVFEYPAAYIYAQAQWPGCEIRPNRPFADIDFQVFAPAEGFPGRNGKYKDRPNEHIAFLEVKRRRCLSTAYESTIVARRKHDAGRWGKHFFQVPVVCVVVFTDTVGVFNLHETPDSEEDIARWDRPEVIVPHVHYAHSRLKWYPELLPKMVEHIEGLAQTSQEVEDATHQ